MKKIAVCFYIMTMSILFLSCNTSCLQGVNVIGKPKATDLIWSTGLISEGGCIGFNKDYKPIVKIVMNSIVYTPVPMKNGKLIIRESNSLTGDWSSRIFIYDSAYKLEKIIHLDTKLTLPGFSFIIDADRILIRAHSAGAYVSQFCILNTKTYEINYFDTDTYSPVGSHPPMIYNNKLYIEDCNWGSLNPEHIPSKVKVVDLATYAVENISEFCLNYPYEGFITMVKGEYLYLFYNNIGIVEKWRISDKAFIKSLELTSLKTGLYIAPLLENNYEYGVFQSISDIGSNMLIMFRDMKGGDFLKDNKDYIFEIDFDTLTLVKTHDFTNKNFYLGPEFYYDNGYLIFNENVLSVIDLETRQQVFKRNLNECITVIP